MSSWHKGGEETTERRGKKLQPPLSQPLDYHTPPLKLEKKGGKIIKKERRYKNRAYIDAPTTSHVQATGRNTQGNRDKTRSEEEKQLPEYFIEATSTLADATRR